MNLIFIWTLLAGTNLFDLAHSPEKALVVRLKDASDVPTLIRFGDVAGEKAPLIVLAEDPVRIPLPPDFRVLTSVEKKLEKPGFYSVENGIVASLSENEALQFLLVSTVNNLQTPNRFSLGKDHVIMQASKNDCGVAVLSMFLRRLGHTPDDTALRKQFNSAVDAGGLTFSQIRSFLKEQNIESIGMRGAKEHLELNRAPAILHVDGNHYVLAVQAYETGIVVLDPSEGRFYWSNQYLAEHWHGIYLTVAP